MVETSPRAHPENSRLRPNETFVFLSPYFVYLSSQTSALQAVYNRFIAPKTTYKPLHLEGRMTPADSIALEEAMHVIIDNPEALEVYGTVSDTVKAEYGSTVHALANLLGQDRIMLLTHERVIPPSLRSLEPQLREIEEGYPYPRFSMQFALPDRYTVFPRDLFNRFGDQFFLSPAALPHFEYPQTDRRFMTSEGGAVLQSGNVVLISESLRNTDPTAEQQKNILRQLGFKVAWFPTTNIDKQPIGKRSITPEHIDGHSALIEGKDGEEYLLIGSSFFHQDKQTEEKIKRATNLVGAQLVEIDDSELPHMAFNFIQLRDGSVALSRTGKKVGSQYLTSNLETALEGIVGMDRVHLLPSLHYLPQRTQAGIRCMSNILPTDFIQKAKEATGQV